MSQDEEDEGQGRSNQSKGQAKGQLKGLGQRLVELGSRWLDFLSNTAKRLVYKSGRAADRDLENEAQMRRREGIGTALVACSFVIAIMGGVGFLIAYWSDANNTRALGGTLAVFLGAMGVTAVLWARWLMSRKEAVEPRHALQSSLVAEAAAGMAFCEGMHDIRKRKLLIWMGLSGTGLFGAMVLSLLRSLGMSPDKSLDSRIWEGGQRLVMLDGKAVSLSTLETGSTVTVYPEDQIGAERAQTVLIRVNEQLLQLPESRATGRPAGM